MFTLCFAICVQNSPISAMITCFTRYTTHTLSKIVLYAKIYYDKKTFRCLEHEPITIVTMLHSIPRFRYFRIFITFQTLKYCTQETPFNAKEETSATERVWFQYSSFRCAALDWVHVHFPNGLSTYVGLAKVLRAVLSSAPVAPVGTPRAGNQNA